MVPNYFLREIVFVETLPGELQRALVEEEPSKRVLLSPLKLLLNEFACYLGQLSTKVLVSFLDFLDSVEVAVCFFAPWAYKVL